MHIFIHYRQPFTPIICFPTENKYPTKNVVEDSGLRFRSTLHWRGHHGTWNDWGSCLAGNPMVNDTVPKGRLIVQGWFVSQYIGNCAIYFLPWCKRWCVFFQAGKRWITAVKHVQSCGDFRSIFFFSGGGGRGRGEVLFYFVPGWIVRETSICFCCFFKVDSYVLYYYIRGVNCWFRTAKV